MTEYMNTVVTRCAPRWAWELIDDTLALDMNSSAFDYDLRLDIRIAVRAMMMACEEPDTETISRTEAVMAEHDE